MNHRLNHQSISCVIYKDLMLLWKRWLLVSGIVQTALAWDMFWTIAPIWFDAVSVSGPVTLKRTAPGLLQILNFGFPKPERLPSSLAPSTGILTFRAPPSPLPTLTKPYQKRHPPPLPQQN